MLLEGGKEVRGGGGEGGKGGRCRQIGRHNCLKWLSHSQNI